MKREEELERAEEAHVHRIEERLSEMWTKSTTDIGNGLDDLLQVGHDFKVNFLTERLEIIRIHNFYQ